jgi:hypothetical protein
VREEIIKYAEEKDNDGKNKSDLIGVYDIRSHLLAFLTNERNIMSARITPSPKDLR